MHTLTRHATGRPPQSPAAARPAADANHRLRFSVASNRLLNGIRPDIRARIADDLQIQDHARGEIVITQGEDSHALYLVLSGELLGILLSREGREVALSQLGRGSFFGEFSALDGGPRSITVSAATCCCLGRLSRHKLQYWIQREPLIGRNLALNLVARNRDLTNRFFELVVHDVDARLRLLLSRLAQGRRQLIDGGILDPAPTHEIMAAHIGANREAVSRALSRLTRDGVITARRRRIRINQVAALLAGVGL